MSDEKALSVFNFDGEKPIRTVTDGEGNPWFVAADVCTAIGVSTEQIRRLDDDEKGLRTMQTPGGTQQVAVINESGLYSLILTSRKAEAKRFKKWITSEVIPSIRKTGQYGSRQLTPAEQLLLSAQQLVAHERQLAEHQERIERIEARQTAAEEGTGYFSVLAYFKHFKLGPIDRTTAQRVGQRASNKSRKQGIPVGQVHDDRWGDVNSYHESILGEVVSEMKGRSS